MSYSGVQPVYGTFPSDLFTGNGSNTVFTMSSVPGNDAALLVTVDGVRQHTDTYSYTANTLTFSEAPGNGAIIETVNMGSRADIIITEGVYKKTQFTATASQTNFTIATGYTVGFVDVYLNGIRLVVADDFTATDGSTIILATAAASGDSVEVVAYGTFNVANALLKSGDTMSGNLVVSGTSTLMSPVAIANTTGNTFVVANTGAVTITGTLTASANINFDSGTFFVDGTNNRVGINSTSPLAPLSLYNASSGLLATLQNATTGTTSGDGSYIALDGNNLQISNKESANVIFYTADTERMRINSSGSVFVGGSTPNTATSPVYSSTTAKVWARLNYVNDSTSTLVGSFNVSSISTAASDYIQINFTAGLANANYPCVTGIADHTGGYVAPPYTRNITTGYVQLSTRLQGVGYCNWANLSMACFA